MLHGLFVRALMNRDDPAKAHANAASEFRVRYGSHAELPHFSSLLNPDLATQPEQAIQSSGYVIDTLTASIWCLLTTNSFSECVLKAVNLGDDTDTTGCVAGGLAGVFYGEGHRFASALYALGESVASASGGGFFGLGNKISADERVILDGLKKLLRLP